jgi:hypothetical protein
MKGHNTFPGKTYVVTCKAGCAITDASGELDETCEPGKQKAISAPSDKLFTSEHAVVRETFNRAALALGLLGGGVDKWGKYSKCVTVDDLKAVNEGYKSDLTPEGEWKWKLPKLTYGKNAFHDVKAIKAWYSDLPELITGSSMFESASLLKSFRGVLPKLQKGDNMFVSTGLENWDGDLPCVTDAYYMFRNTLLINFRGDFPKLKSSTGVFYQSKKLQRFEGDLSYVQDAYAFFLQCRELRHVYTNLSSLASAGAFLNEAQIDKLSALSILGSIPAYTSGSHPLTIGIHVDHQTDEEVIAAIEAAEAKGWTVAVQWNGTATAAAASTWGRRKPVFARLGEAMEDGTPNLDWGHYVTDPSGYTEFASLEEAKEHFNITD